MNINLKKVISSVAALAMSLSCFTAFAADFSDVEATSTYKNAIDELVALEIVNGYEDGTFKPDNEITRAEVTKMVVAAMGPSFRKGVVIPEGNILNHAPTLARVLGLTLPQAVGTAVEELLVTKSLPQPGFSS